MLLLLCCLLQVLKHCVGASQSLFALLRTHNSKYFSTQIKHPHTISCYLHTNHNYFMLLPCKGFASVSTAGIDSTTLATFQPVVISDPIRVEGSSWGRLGLLLLVPYTTSHTFR